MFSVQLKSEEKTLALPIEDPDFFSGKFGPHSQSNSLSV